ncbi:MAG: DoxX family protein, partial [Chloroflexota bacterium]
MSEHIVKTTSGRIIEDPPFARFLFSNTRLSVVWLVIRVLIGYSWLSAGLEKLSNPAWTQTGAALQGFWTGAVTVSATGKTPITFDWYRSFIQGMLDNGSYVWFAKLIVAGEVLVGIALIIGAFVGVAAFFAALLNWNFIMAGSASSNGLLLVGAIVL